MLRLIFTVCMINAPDTCEQREMLVYEPMPVMACVMGAMPELATWRETHPNWRVARWRCEDNRTVQGLAPVERTAQGSAPVERTAQRTPAAVGLQVTAPAPLPVAISR